MSSSASYQLPDPTMATRFFMLPAGVVGALCAAHNEKLISVDVETSCVERHGLVVMMHD